MKHDSDILKRIKNYFMRRKSADEAHAFEREIERDAFLYEAIEGLEDILSSDLQQALDELDDRLDERIAERPLYLKWQLAASVAVLLTFGAGIYALIQKKGPQNDVNITYQLDSIKTVSDSTVYQPREEAISFNPLQDFDEESNDSQSLSLSTIGNESTINEPVLNEEPKKEIAKDEAIVFAEVDEMKSKKSVSPEAQMDASRDLISETNTEEIAVTGSETGTRFNTQTTANNTAASKAVTSVSEVKLNMASDEPAVNVLANERATPVGGRMAYDAYIKRSVRRTPGMPEGLVTLQFEFDKDGRPKKIEIVRSLCTACDLEAKRIISEGPSWQVTDRKEVVTISVPFE